MEYYNKDDKNRGKLAPPFMEDGMILGARRAYRIEKMVGGGGFGQVYRAVDMDCKLVVAVKVEPKSVESGRLILELEILLKLGNCIHVPRIYYSGEMGNYNFIVMQMLGKNVGDLRRTQRNRTLTPVSASKIGVQSLECMKQFHSMGYVHRDIKPSNICIGIGEYSRIIYILDFGMARKIRSRDGTFRPERTYASFRGTTRYVSITAHERKEQGFVDDIWSLFYSIVELIDVLPWKNLLDQDEVYLSKKVFMRNYQSRKMNRNFEMFPKTLERCRRTELPDYEKLISILKNSCNGFNDLEEFDWELDEPPEMS